MIDVTLCAIKVRETVPRRGQRMDRSSGPGGRAEDDAPVEWLPGRPSRQEVMRRLEALRLYQATEEGRAEAIERARSIAAHASGLAGAIEADGGAPIPRPPT